VATSSCAVTIAIAATALPYLSRPLHRLVASLVTLASIAAVVTGSALPANTVSSLAIGGGVAAGLHLAAGSPLGLPFPAEIIGWITGLGVPVEGIARAPRQVWGVEKLTARNADGRAIELSVYGRDASDARMLGKLWRFCFYRDSEAPLILDRLQQVEHEAYLIFMPGRADALVPEVLAASKFGPSKDAALVTRLPDGRVLAEADDATLCNETLEELLQTVLRLRKAGLAHGALGAETIIITTYRICLRDFRCDDHDLVVITMASIIGGAVSVPGGLGVVEAGLIAGLTSAGIPQDQAVAAVFIQRLFTAYLPPIWGWATLTWMRRREYV
jgi:tRNA A-37 threonylcarbamoyl transferase component Bud32